jgi:predicted MFS family arabinose efflux permease
VSRGRGLALAFVFVGSNVGGVAVPVFAEALAARGSWRDALLWLAGAALCVLLPFAALGLREPEPRDVARPEAGPAATSLDLREALRTRSFWILAIALLAFWAYLFTMLQHLVLALMDAGMPRDGASAHLSNAIAMGMFSKIAFGWIADRVSARTALLLDFGLLALSSLLLLAVPGTSAAMLWGFVICFGFSYAARDVVTPLAIAHCFGSRNLAQIYGVLMLTILPGSAGAIFAGWSYDQTGSYGLAFTALAATSAATFALLFLVRDERRIS